MTTQQPKPRWKIFYARTIIGRCFKVFWLLFGLLTLPLGGFIILNLIVHGMSLAIQDFAVWYVKEHEIKWDGEADYMLFGDSSGLIVDRERRQIHHISDHAADIYSFDEIKGYEQLWKEKNGHRSDHQLKITTRSFKKPFFIVGKIDQKLSDQWFELLPNYVEAAV